MRVLVTGGAGFIGSHVVDVLVESGHDVVVVDREHPRYQNAKADYRRADIGDPTCWDEILVGVDAVSHQAAKVGLGVRFDDVVSYVTDNDLGTAVMLSALERAGFHGRIVLAGSMVAYGEGSYRCPRCGPVRPGPRSATRLAAGQFEPPCPICGGDIGPDVVEEDDPIDPRNVYAATKVHQEHLCAAYGRQSGSAVISLRYHNVYGPRSPKNTPYAGVASLFLDAIARGQAARVFEDGGQRRDFVHVRDVARANLLALEAPASVTGAFNVSSGQPRTIGELAQALFEALGRSGPGPVVTGEWRLGDVRHIVASPRRAAATLDFRADVPFEEGMGELAQSAPWSD